MGFAEGMAEGRRRNRKERYQDRSGEDITPRVLGHTRSRTGAERTFKVPISDWRWEMTGNLAARTFDTRQEIDCSLIMIRTEETEDLKVLSYIS